MPNFLSFDKKDYGRIVKYNADWKLHHGGYVLAYFERFKFFTLPISFIFAHCFKIKGRIGTENGKPIADHKEFMIRFSYQVEESFKASFFEIQLLNPLEARWFYIFFKISPRRQFTICFNLGYRLSKKSRDFIKGTIAETMMMQKANSNGKGDGLWRSQKQVFIQS